MGSGNVAVLTMVQPLCKAEKLDRKAYMCKLLAYDSKQAVIKLLLQEAQLQEVSLDALYQCQVQAKEQVVRCVGRIQERYRSNEGPIIELQVKNGFYIDKE